MNVNRHYEHVFINGVFETLLDEISDAQRRSPELILHLQPVTKNVMTRLKKDVPLSEKPIKIYLSTSKSLNTVSFEGKIVRWRNKRDLNAEEGQKFVKTLKENQESEGRFAFEPEDGSVNLLDIRNLHKLSEPFPVSELIKASDGTPLKERSRAGGWLYVTRVKPN